MASSRLSLIQQHDVNLVNYGPIYLRIDYKAGDALGPENQDRGSYYIM